MFLFDFSQNQLPAAAGAPVIEVELKWGAYIISIIYAYGSRLAHRVNRPSKLTQQQMLSGGIEFAEHFFLVG